MQLFVDFGANPQSTAQIAVEIERAANTPLPLSISFNLSLSLSLSFYLYLTSLYLPIRL